MIFSNGEVRTRIASTLRIPPGEVGPGKGQQHPSEQWKLSKAFKFMPLSFLPWSAWDGKGLEKTHAAAQLVPQMQGFAKILVPLQASASTDLLG